MYPCLKVRFQIKILLYSPNIWASTTLHVRTPYTFCTWHTTQQKWFSNSWSFFRYGWDFFPLRLRFFPVQGEFFLTGVWFFPARVGEFLWSVGVFPVRMLFFPVRVGFFRYEWVIGCYLWNTPKSYKSRDTVFVSSPLIWGYLWVELSYGKVSQLFRGLLIDLSVGNF